MSCRLIAILAVSICAAGVASAQTLPDEPIVFGRGRVVLGGDVAVSVAPEDEGFFNYADYEHSTLRELRITLGARIRVTDRVSVLADVRSENLDEPIPFALYARVRPMTGRRFDIQIGRIPPVFGVYPRQAYGRDAILIGVPLAYQYLTSLRADAVPATPDELLLMRGRGWLSSFSVGQTVPARGVPLVSSTRWDTGVQASAGWKMVSVAAAVTAGTPSRPLVADDNAGKQISARLAVTPAPGLVLGTSAARGQFLSRRLFQSLPDEDPGRFAQHAYGLDAEYSRGHGLVRTELVFSRWRIPMPLAPSPDQTLRALAAAVEGRYTLRPGLYMAARAEHLTFNHIAGSSGSQRWEAPVSRVEIGGGYSLQRNLVARASLQMNRRDGGRVTRARLLAGQLLYWF